MIGALSGLILLHPSFTALVGADTAPTFFGIPVTAVKYASTIFPALFGVWIQSKIEHPIYKAMPSVVRSIFRPFLTIACMSLLMFFVTGPVGYYFGQGLANAVLALSGPPFGLGLATLSAVQPVLVVFDAHTVLAPPMIGAISRGGGMLIRPAFIMASFANFGAMPAIAVRLKDPKAKSAAWGCVATSFLGTNEPAIYGYLLPLFKPFLCTLGSTFAGGLVASLVHVCAYAMGKNGVFGWLVFQETMPGIIVASAAAAAVGFVLTYVVGFDEKKLSA